MLKNEKVQSYKVKIIHVRSQFASVPFKELIKTKLNANFEMCVFDIPSKLIYPVKSSITKDKIYF